MLWDWLKKFKYGEHLAVVLSCWLFFTVATSSILIKTDTTDEKFHLIRGLMLLETGDLRINQHHPYLANLIAAAPTYYLTDVKIPSTDTALWQEANKDGLSFELVDINGGSVNFSAEHLFPARVMMISISTLFILGFYTSTKKIWNPKVAAVATFFLITSPTFLTHSRLVTTDVPSMIAGFGATYFFYRWMTESKKLSIKSPLFYTYVVVLFLGILTKYNLLFVAFIHVVILFATILSRQSKLSVKSVLTTTKIFTPKFFAIVLPVLILLIAAYQFQFATMQDMAYGNQYKIDDILSAAPKLEESGRYRAADALEWVYTQLHFPFPQFVNGFFENILKHDHFGHSSFLLGQFSNQGWWYYFPFAFLVKEALATVVLMIAFSLIYIYRIKDRAAESKAEFVKYMPFVVTPIFLMLLSMKSSINLGVRHILIMLPFAYMFIAFNSVQVLKKHAASLPVRLVAIFIAVFTVGSLSQHYPDFLSYFNESVDKQNGYLYLRDSNLHWGQNKQYRYRGLFTYEKSTDSARAFERDEYYDYYVTKYTTLYRNPEKAGDDLNSIREKVGSGEYTVVKNYSNTHLVIKRS